MKNKGFTIIELIVVIAIIAIIAAIIIVTLSTSKQRGADAGNKEAVHQLHNALELYHADQGDYPANLATLNNSSYYNSTIPNNTGIFYSLDCLTYGGAVGGAMASCFVLDVPITDTTGNVAGQCWRDDSLGNGLHACYNAN